MGSRGRTSAAALAARADNVLSLGVQKAPPADLSEFRAAVWRRIMESPCGEWIGEESYDLLRDYTSMAEAVHLYDLALGKQKDPSDLDALAAYDRARQARDRVAKAMREAAAKLRIAPSARVHKEHAGTVARKPRGQKPWEV